jgi:DNA-binding NarL/FixJ family response regulator
MRALKFMVLEDEPVCMALIKKILSKKFPYAEITTEDNPYSIYLSTFEKPDILIVDYQFRYPITACKDIIDKLFRFKGLVVIYSGHDKKHIEKDFIRNYNIVPKNFRIINKNNSRELLSEVCEYISKRDNGFFNPAHK